MITPNFICDKKNYAIKEQQKKSLRTDRHFSHMRSNFVWYFNISLNFFLHVSLDGIVNPKAFMNYDDMLIFLVDSPAF